MNNHNNKELSRQNGSDEIDLREIFSSLNRFFASLWRGFLNTILSVRRASRRFVFLIIGLLLLGAIGGYLYYSTNGHYFKARMVIDTRYYTTDLLESILDNFNEQALIGSSSALAKELDISEEQASAIKSFIVEPVMSDSEKADLRSYLNRIEVRGEKFTAEQLDSLQHRLLLNADQYIISVEVYDNTVLGELQNGLISFLSSKDYVSRRVKVENENLNMLKSSIEKDEQSLAKLKDELASRSAENPTGFRSGSNTVFLGADGEGGPKNIYQQSIELYNQKASINRRLLLNQEVEVVSDFTPTEKPASLSLPESLVWGAVCGIVLAYLLIALISINRALNNYERRTKYLKST